MKAIVHECKWIGEGISVNTEYEIELNENRLDQLQKLVGGYIEICEYIHMKIQIHYNIYFSIYML